MQGKGKGSGQGRTKTNRKIRNGTRSVVMLGLLGVEDALRVLDQPLDAERLPGHVAELGAGVRRAHERRCKSY